MGLKTSRWTESDRVGGRVNSAGHSVVGGKAQVEMQLIQNARQSCMEASPEPAGLSSPDSGTCIASRQARISIGRHRLPWSILLLAAVNMGAFISVQVDKAYIREVAFRLVPPESDRRKTIEACLDFVHRELKDNNIETVNTMPFWARVDYLWNPRRVGPRMVLEHGTHHMAPCQAHNRAFGALLDAHGISWRVVALHSSDLRGSHGIMQVEFGNDQFGMVDSHYGILYKNRDGSPATLQQLRSDPELTEMNQRSACQIINLEGQAPSTAPYPVGVDGYGFSFPAYTNFREFGPLRWWVRDRLNGWFGPDGYLLIRRPQMFMWPAYNLAVGLDLLAIFIWICLVMYRRIRRRSLERPVSVAMASTARR